MVLYLVVGGDKHEKYFLITPLIERTLHYLHIMLIGGNVESAL